MINYCIEKKRKEKRSYKKIHHHLLLTFNNRVSDYNHIVDPYCLRGE